MDTPKLADSLSFEHRPLRDDQGYVWLEEVLAVGGHRWGCLGEGKSGGGGTREGDMEKVMLV